MWGLNTNDADEGLFPMNNYLLAWKGALVNTADSGKPDKPSVFNLCDHQADLIHMCCRHHLDPGFRP